MAAFPAITWLILALIAGAAVLGMLHGIALIVRNQLSLHEERLKRARLKLRYAALQAEQQAGEIIEVDEEEIGDVDIVDDPAETVAKAA